MRILLFILFISITTSTKVYAYPNFIGHGYNSCITCHYNPFGNGPLNDYGRALSGTAIASRSFYDENKPEDQIGNETGFFFKQPKNKHIRPSLSYRGLLLKRNFGDASEKTEYIHMQADANLVLKFGMRDQFYTSLSFGYAPVPRAYKGTPLKQTTKKYRSREHYVAWKPTNEWGVYAGLMDKVYGIRLVEHTAYSRTTPLLTMNDQAHGVTLHYAVPEFEAGINYFVGNLAQEDKDLRAKGVSGTFEFTVAEKNRLGMSVLTQSNQFVSVMATGIHTRHGLSAGNSILFEVGNVIKKPKMAGAEKKREMYGMLQNHIKMARGFYLLNSIEYYKNTAEDSYRVRFGPSFQYFPMSRVEFRLDLYDTRNFSQKSSTKDTWDLLAQVHLWL